jgi:uncharacterized protein with PIN domain
MTLQMTLAARVAIARSFVSRETPGGAARREKRSPRAIITGVEERIEAGFRHRLRALLAQRPAVEREALIAEWIAAARERSRTEGLPEARALFMVHEDLRAREPRAADRSAAPRFLCDRSLGGLARWLRAAGYEAYAAPAVAGHRLPDEALRRGLVLLTTDTEVLERRIVGDGSLRVVWLPSALRTREKLALVLRDLGLPLVEPRCMACGGALLARSKETVRPRIPPRTALWQDEYFVCAECDRLFWRGTHWERIERTLRHAVAA